MEKRIDERLQKARLVSWRSQGTVTRIPGPTNLKSARSLGYKAKQGVVMVRVKVTKGKRKRPKFAGGRNPKKAGRFFSLNKSKRQVAEEKAARKYPNLNVLNSYKAGEDGTHQWYECVMLDTSHPAITKDKKLKWIAGPKQKGRANRGLTSAGKKSRGLRK